MDWNQIVRENTKEMLRLAKRIVGSEAEAEELVQEAFLKPAPNRPTPIHFGRLCPAD